MPDFTTYTLEEFVFDPTFQDWVKHPTRETDAYWQHWLDQHPEKRTEVEQARQIVLGIRVEQPTVSDEQIRRDVQRMLTRLQASEPVVRPLWAGGRSFVRWVAAASVLVAAGLIWWRLGTSTESVISRQQNSVTLPDDATQQAVNQTKQPLSLRLPDGSQVTLSPGSTLTYPATFGDTSREVSLIGEAFFNVVRNPAKPFAVYTDAIVTRVLGTSFLVRAYRQDRQVSVSVRTGKVSVYNVRTFQAESKVAANGVILTPNQQVTLRQTDGSIARSLVEKPLPLPTETNNALDFENRPVSEVIDALAKTYGIPIVYNKERLSQCRVTVTLENDPLYTQLDLLSKLIDGRYKVVDVTIHLYADGCQ